jgi:hypothetical protein
MANILSYKQVLDTLQSIAERHYLINSFYVGENYDMNAADLIYPVLQVYPTIARLPQTNGEYKTIEITLKCKVVDRDTQDNELTNDVHNDTLRICQDIINEVNQHPFYLHSNTQLVGDIEMGQMSEFLDDYLTGWEFDLNLKLLNTNSFCGLPIAEIPGYSAAGPIDSDYSISWQYLTCETITGCTNLTNFIDTYIQNNPTIFNTKIQNGLNTYTGGTALQPTINVSGGTVNNWNVTGGAMSSGGTNLYNIFLTAADVSGTTVSAGSNISVSNVGLNYQISTVASPSFNNITSSGSSSFNVLSATTFYSGATPLQTIISNVSPNLTNGTNTYVGTSGIFRTVNISGGTLNNLTVTGNTILSSTTATTVSILNSGRTVQTLADYASNLINTGVSLSSIVGGSGNTIHASALNVQIIGGDDITSSRDHYSYMTNLIVTGTSHGKIYATQIFSGNTDLSLLIGTGGGDGNDVTRVSGSGNILTGGTATNPIISITSSPSFNNITYSGTSTGGNSIATNVSATTIFSGSSNVSSLFVTQGIRFSASTIFSGSTDLSNLFERPITAGNYLQKSGSTTIWLSGAPCDFAIALSDETTAITTGTNKVTLYAPYAFTITDVRASLTTSGSSVTTTFDIKNGGTTIFSTKPTIDAGKYTTATSATPRVITGTTVALDAKLTIDITSIGTNATGAKIYIIGNKTL